MSRIIAVTGGTGFLGYHLIPVLVEKGYRVRLLRRPGSAHPLVKEYPPAVEWRDVDFRNEASLQDACRGANAVVHAAGLVSYSRKDDGLMRETHVGLTRRVLRAARAVGASRFVHVSSIVTLGQGKELRDERSEFNAFHLKLTYWSTKKESEDIALAANEPGVFDVIVVNPGTLIGPGEKGSQLLPFLRRLAASERPFLPDGGSDFVNASDAARGVVLALAHGRPGERYILGAENLSYAAFHEKLRKALGLGPSRPRILPRWFVSLAQRGLAALEAVARIDLPVNAARLRRVNGVFMFHDSSKARRELGYSPRAIEEGLSFLK